MDYKREDDKLTVKLLRDFNLYTASRIERLAADATEVEIDLSRSKFVDSEAIRVLWGLVTAGKRVTLINPPELFGTVVEVLGLKSFFDDGLSVQQRSMEGEGA